jgi:hypothetical protein
MASIQQIRLVLQGMPKWRGQSEAHERIIWAACARCTFYDSISETIEKLGAEGKLEPYAAYRDAFVEVFAEEAIQDNAATRDLVVQRMIQLGLPSTVQGMGLAVAELLHEEAISRTPGRQAQINESQRQHEEREHQARETERMIAEMSGYMLDDSGRVKPEYHLQYKSKIARLSAMPFADLTARYNQVIEARTSKKMPVEAVREIVKTGAQASRREIFSTTPPEVVLTNPNTNQPFASRKELVNVLHNLSREETRAFFSFPSGKQKPGVAEAVSKILKDVR